MNDVFVIFQGKSCLEICDLWCHWCCCGCGLGRQYADHFDLALLGQNNSSGQTLENTSSPMSPVTETVRISSTPDRQQLCERKDDRSVSRPQLQVA